MKPDFFLQFYEKNIQITSLMKIRRVGAELLRADRWTDGCTDVTKLIVTFDNFANEPKKFCPYDIPFKM